jgi:hypothetical protein
MQKRPASQPMSSRSFHPPHSCGRSTENAHGPSGQIRDTQSKAAQRRSTARPVETPGPPVLLRIKPLKVEWSGIGCWKMQPHPRTGTDRKTARAKKAVYPGTGSAFRRMAYGTAVVGEGTEQIHRGFTPVSLCFGNVRSDFERDASEPLAKKGNFESVPPGLSLISPFW